MSMSWGSVAYRVPGYSESVNLRFVREGQLSRLSGHAPESNRTFDHVTSSSTLTTSVSSSSPCLPRLQLFVFHPRRHTIDTFPSAAKFPCSPHPNPYGRRLADRPHHIGRRQSIKTATNVAHITRDPSPIAPLPDHVVIRKGLYCKLVHLSPSCTFLCPLLPWTLALHSTVSYFTLVFVPLSTTAPHSLSPSMRPLSRTLPRFSKISTFRHRCSSSTSTCGSVAGSTSFVPGLFPFACFVSLVEDLSLLLRIWI